MGALPYGTTISTLFFPQDDFPVDADLVVIQHRLGVGEVNVWSASVSTLSHLSHIHLPHLESEDVVILIRCDAPGVQRSNDCGLGS